MKRIASTSSVFGAALSGFGGVYTNVWKVLLTLSTDPFPVVSDMAKKLCTNVKQKVLTQTCMSDIFSCSLSSTPLTVSLCPSYSLSSTPLTVSPCPSLSL